MQKQWLIAGVGRSGTTAIYEAAQTLARSQAVSFDFSYEPYLWGEAVWLDDHSKVKSEFQSTSSLNRDGIITHLSVPLFLGDTHNDTHAQFVRRVYPERVSVLAKVIRGSGRLHHYLSTLPDLKIIYVIRNPMDTVNSVVGLFSYFGDEFHPSDKERFKAEVLNTDVLGCSWETEVGKAASWWYHMNEAALNAAAQFPKRVFVLPYESFQLEPGPTFARLASFLNAEIVPSATMDFSRPAGPTTAYRNLLSEDVRLLTPLTEYYFESLLKQSAVPLQFDTALKCDVILSKYQSVPPGVFAPIVSRDLSPLVVRSRYAEMSENFGKLTAEVTSLKVRSGVNDVFLHEAKQALVARDRLRLRAIADMETHIVPLKNSRVLKIGRAISNNVSQQFDRAFARISVNRNAPDLSCVVTSYNNGLDLIRAVDSVLAQSLRPNEIIIVDDGSESESLEIARSISDSYDIVRLIARRDNIGPGPNRHEGILSARHFFITTLDGDDEFAPNKVQSEWTSLRESVNSVAFSDFALIESERVIRVDTSRYVELDPRQRLDVTLNRLQPLPHNMMYSKTLYASVGGYDLRARMYEDWALKLRLARDVSNWVHTGALGLIYYRHGTGLSSASSDKHAFWKLFVLAHNDWISTVVKTDMLLSLLNTAIGDEYSAQISDLRTKSDHVTQNFRGSLFEVVKADYRSEQNWLARKAALVDLLGEKLR